MRASGHRVLITGGGTGIGLALAQRFLREGNAVVIAGRRVEVLQQALASLPGAQAICADVASPDDRQRLVAEAGPVSVLINNAAVRWDKPIHLMQSSAIEGEIAINLTAPVLLTQSLLPTLRGHDEAAIVNVSSGLALVPKQNAPIYCASKAALHSWSIALRWELEGSPVRVVEVLPPMVRTPMSRHSGNRAITPDALADEFWRGWLAGRPEMHIGITKYLPPLQRLSRTLAERVLRHGE